MQSIAVKTSDRAPAPSHGLYLHIYPPSQIPALTSPYLHISLPQYLYVGLHLRSFAFPARFRPHCMLYKEYRLGSSITARIDINKKHTQNQQEYQEEDENFSLNLNVVHAKKLRLTSICMRVR